MSWGYSETNGPDTWVRDFPVAGHSHQSPINIVTSDVTNDVTMPPLCVNYDPHDVTEVRRSAHGVEFAAQGSNSTLTGGPLKGVFKLAQFHWHWGSRGSEGSEHTVDGHSYACELHLVHYNAEKYSSLGEAAPHSDGLAVLGIFIQVGAENPGFDKISKYLHDVIFKDQKSQLNEGFNPAVLLPENISEYWTYSGSLTTPPCYESVRWIVLKNPVTYSEKQLELFRSLYNEPSGAGDQNYTCLLKNFRPPQPLNDRKVLASFQS